MTAQSWIAGLDIGGTFTDVYMVEAIARSGARAVAVCLLHSYANPRHERRFGELLAARLPAVAFSLSSDLLPEMREYERATSTTANAYVLPRVRQYLARLEDGLSTRLFVMLSSGGITTPDIARKFPVRLCESGPAAGAVMAGEAGRALALPRVLSFDMGGTTAKTCLIENGAPIVTTEFEVARHHRFKKGSGLPLRMPVVDMIEIGAGGGSIARVDDLGLLKVGPESAGAAPGPACYGRGGLLPTVTDADLVLGYLASDAFLGGTMALDGDRAHSAIRDHVAGPLGLSVEEAALGIHAVVDETMANAARIHIAERGLDPASHVLIAFGGAGPVHAEGVARRLGIGSFVVPGSAGVGSALGLLLEPRAYRLSRTLIGTIDAIDWTAVERAFEDMPGTQRRCWSAPEWRRRRSFLPGSPRCAIWDSARSWPSASPTANSGRTRRARSGAPSRPSTSASTGAYMPGTRSKSGHCVLSPRAHPSSVPSRFRRRVRRNSGRSCERSGWRDRTHPARHGFTGVSGFPPAPASRARRSSRNPTPQSWLETVRSPHATAAAISSSNSGEAVMAGRDGTIDPVRIEICWNRLVSIASEQAATMVNSAFSTILGEMEDLSAAVFDARGVMLAQSVQGAPGHLGTLSIGMDHIIDAVGAAGFGAGDVFITNDPWLVSGHKHDITVVTPVHHGCDLVGFTASNCHTVDIGGRIFSAEGETVYEEGLQIPILKLFDGGVPNDTLFRIIEDNVRSPELVLGDLAAQVSANHVAGDRMRAFMDAEGLADLVAIADEITARTERKMRRAIAALPDGTYRGSVMLDGFGEPLTIAVAVTIAGDEVDVDFAGTSPQIGKGVNCVLNYTKAFVFYALKCALSPEIPNNDGTLRPIRVRAPEGSILNARHPAPVGGRHLVGLFVPFAIFDALAPVIPDRIIAESSVLGAVTLAGEGDDDAPYVFTFFCSGGMGARADKNGLDATAFPSNVANAPVEVIEQVLST